MKKLLSIIFVMLVLSGCSIKNNNPTTDKNEALQSSPSSKQGLLEEENKTSQITVTVGEKVFEATMCDNATSKELLKKFPLTLTMNEQNGNEKYYKFEDSFINNPQNITKIKAGELMLWQDSYLVLFYKDIETTYNYTKIGYINDVTGLLNAVGKKSVVVRFENK